MSNPSQFHFSSTLTHFPSPKLNGFILDEPFQALKVESILEITQTLTIVCHISFLATEPQPPLIHPRTFPGLNKSKSIL